MIDTKKCDLRVSKTTISGGARTIETVFEGWVSPTTMHYLIDKLELDISGWRALKPVRFCVEIVDSVGNGRTRLGTLEFSKLGTDPISHVANFRLHDLQTCALLVLVVENIRSSRRMALRTDRPEEYTRSAAHLLLQELEQSESLTGMLQ